MVRNDAVDIGQVHALLQAGSVHHIILSPGPGSPDTPGDIGEPGGTSCKQRHSLPGLSAARETGWHHTAAHACVYGPPSSSVARHSVLKFCSMFDSSFTQWAESDLHYAARVAGVCLDVLAGCPSTPLLGVCLGHQALAVAAGGSVLRAPEPVHGRLSTLSHTGHELFAGCPSGPGSGFDVVR